MYTDALPGGCLQTLVFRCVNLYHRPVNAYIYSSSFLLPPPISGADGDATLYEDDGVSVAYQTGDDKSRRGCSSDAALLLYRMSLTSRNSVAGDVRSTQFTWTDSTATLQVPRSASTHSPPPPPPPPLPQHQAHFETSLQWSVTSPAYDGSSKYTCVQAILVRGAVSISHLAVPLGLSGSISFK
jgi:hypothetical protein